MKQRKTAILCTALSLLLIAISVSAGSAEEKTWTFDRKEIVEINTVSGDCTIVKGKSGKIEVSLVYNIRPEDSFEPKVRERGDKLVLSERFHGSSSGYSQWTISVPDDTWVRFSSASGEFSIAGLKSRVSVETASGDITVEDCIGEMDLETASGNVILEKVSGEINASNASGDIEAREVEGLLNLGTASGDIEVDGATGEMDLGTASGDIEANELVIKEQSAFQTASGRVSVQLAAPVNHDLLLSTASGRVDLDFDGNPVEGYFEFVAKARRGQIVSPFDFDDEKEFRQSGERYVRKSFTKGSETPTVALETASGKLTLSK